MKIKVEKRLPKLSAEVPVDILNAKGTPLEYLRYYLLLESKDNVYKLFSRAFKKVLLSTAEEVLFPSYVITELTKRALTTQQYERENILTLFPHIEFVGVPCSKFMGTLKNLNTWVGINYDSVDNVEFPDNNITARMRISIDKEIPIYMSLYLKRYLEEEDTTFVPRIHPVHGNILEEYLVRDYKVYTEDIFNNSPKLNIGDSKSKENTNKKSTNKEHTNKRNKKKRQNRHTSYDSDVHWVLESTFIRDIPISVDIEIPDLCTSKLKFTISPEHPLIYIRTLIFAEQLI